MELVRAAWRILSIMRSGVDQVAGEVCPSDVASDDAYRVLVGSVRGLPGGLGCISSC